MEFQFFKQLLWNLLFSNTAPDPCYLPKQKPPWKEQILVKFLEAVALPDRLYLNTTSRIKCQILSSMHCFISY